MSVNIFKKSNSALVFAIKSCQKAGGEQLWTQFEAAKPPVAFAKNYKFRTSSVAIVVLLLV